MMFLRGIFVFAALLGPTCSTIGGSDWERSVGYLDAHLGIPVLQAPDTVAVGQAFTVTVTTLGNSCTRADGAEVETDPADPLLRIVRPYDRHRTTGICHDIGMTFPRDVELRFDQAGEAVVRVVGDSHPEQPNQFEARVVVR
jgi:hypothetical protein